MNSQNETTPKYVIIQPDHQVAEDEIDLIQLLGVLKKRFKIVVVLVVLGTIISIFYALSLPEIYKSTATITTTSSNGNDRVSNLLGGFSGTAAMFGFGSRGGDKSQDIVNFLLSRELKIRLIEKYDLLPIIFANKKGKKNSDLQSGPTLERGISALDGVFEASSDLKSGLISISWQDENPEFCKKMLDRVIDELKQYLDFDFVSDAKRARVFVESQLANAEQELKKWEKQVPSETITNSEILRERNAAVQVYTDLRKQLEHVKITEAQEMVEFKVLDAPFVPDERFKPSRRLIVTLAFVVSVFIAIFFAFFLDFLQKTRKTD